MYNSNECSDTTTHAHTHIHTHTGPHSEDKFTFLLAESAISFDVLQYENDTIEPYLLMNYMMAMTKHKSQATQE